jgi:hypothetical protein
LRRRRERRKVSSPLDQETEDPDHIPPSARHLVPFAGRWAIGDDYEREAAVDGATDSDLSRLVNAVAAPHDDVWDWLAGPGVTLAPLSEDSETVARTTGTRVATK